MPQHWIGRAAVALALVLAAATVQPSNSSAAQGTATGSLSSPLAVSSTISFASGESQLLSALSLAAASDSAALSLPWTAGTAWRLTGGPHNNSGKSVHPWSALDFASPTAGASAKVRAARGGVVSRPCRNLVQIRHADGWTTLYYHLAGITVSAGQHVQRGQLLGYTSTRSGCGGYATGSHVHFAVLRNGSHVDLNGFSIGGWAVREGKAQYYGCLIRPDKKKCAPSDYVKNTGAIGTQ